MTQSSCDVSKHPCVSEQSEGCCGAAGSPWGQGSCASTKGSPQLAPFAQKTVISKGKYRLQLLVCMDEFNFCRKRLQIVVVNSCLKPGIMWTQINAWNETCLGEQCCRDCLLRVLKGMQRFANSWACLQQYNSLLIKTAVPPSRTGESGDEWYDVITLQGLRTNKRPSGLGPKYKPYFDTTFPYITITLSLCIDPDNFSVHVSVRKTVGSLPILISCDLEVKCLYGQPIQSCRALMQASCMVSSNG